MNKAVKEFEERVRNYVGSTPNPHRSPGVGIFIRVPRTGSTSLMDVIRGEHRHIPAKEYKKYMGEKAFNGYFKYSVCRNPYTRFVSMYQSMPPVDKEDVNVVIENGHVPALLRDRIRNFLPQWHYLCEDDEILVDYLGRFENLEQVWQKICEANNVSNMELPHHAATKKVELSEKSKELIYPFYRKDFELFNYKP